MIHVKEHHSKDYAPRTGYNAKSADWTLALAVDLDTAGERLTKKLADPRYTGMLITKPTLPSLIAQELLTAIKKARATSLNIAGNGIYTLSRHGWSQSDINELVFRVLRLVHAENPLERVFTGGQTGVDMAGAIAAAALGIDAEVTLPKGFRQRNTAMQDENLDKETIERQIIEGTKALVFNTPLTFRELPSFKSKPLSGVTASLF